MRKIHDWDTVSRWPSGHHNPHDNLIVKLPRCRKATVELESSAGTQDRVILFRHGDQLYVLSINHRMPYVGIARYDLSPASIGKMKEGEALSPAGDAFFQEHEQVTDALGPKETDLDPYTIVRRLADLL